MKILIVGYGSIGKKHEKTLRMLGHNDIDLCDPYVLGTATYEWMIEKSHYDAVYICTPTSEHMRQAIIAANYGCHVFVEKPLSNEIREAQLIELKEAVRSQQVVAMVAVQPIFMESFKTFKSIVNIKHDEALYVTIHHGYRLSKTRDNYLETYAANKQLGGGCILDNAIYDFDALRRLFPKRKIVKEHSVAARLHRGMTVDTEDFFGTVLSIDSGHILQRNPRKIPIFMTVDYLSIKPEWTIRVVFEHQEIIWRHHECSIEHRKPIGLDGNLDVQKYSKVEGAFDCYAKQDEHFFDCIKNGTKPLNSIEFAEETLRLLFACSTP